MGGGGMSIMLYLTFLATLKASPPSLALFRSFFMMLYPSAVDTDTSLVIFIYWMEAMLILWSNMNYVISVILLRRTLQLNCKIRNESLLCIATLRGGLDGESNTREICGVIAEGIGCRWNRWWREGYSIMSIRFIRVGKWGRTTV